MSTLPPTDSLAEWLLRHRDAASGVAVGSQLVHGLRDAILQAVMQPGQRLPSSRALADRVGVARNTVVAAYTQLQAEGFVVAGHGSGTYVRPVVQERVAIPAAPARGATAVVAPSLSRRGQRYVRDPVHRFWVERPFCPGMFSAALFPHALWNRLTMEEMRSADTAHLGRGRSGGALELRAAIAAHVHATRGVRCAVEQVVLTDGTAQSISLVARLLCDAGDHAFIEDPCYWAARCTLEDLGLVIDPLQVDEHGAPPPPEPAPGHKPAKLAYLTPSHQFPTGAAMPTERRLAWLAYAREHGTLLLEDDYDSEFRYKGPPFPSLQGLDAETGGGNRVVYLGSFSKTMFPGIRLAFLIVPPTLAEVFASAATDYDRDGDQLLQATMGRFIAEGHFAAHVRKLRLEFGERREALVQALLRHVPELLSTHPPFHILGGARGVHVALALPEGTDDRVIAQAAAERGITAVPMSAYAVTSARRGVILSVAGVALEDIPQAVLQLVPALVRGH